MKLNIIWHRKISLYSLLRSFYAPECLFSSWLYLDFLLMKSSLSSSISRYAPCPGNVLKCSVHKQGGKRGRAELQTVLISYASHVASSTNRRYLIEILITVGTHWRIHRLWHSMTRAMELSSLLEDVLCVGTMPFVFGCLLSVITLTSYH